MFHLLVPFYFSCCFFNVALYEFLHQFLSFSWSSTVAVPYCYHGFSRLFLTVTTGFPGPLIVDVVGLTLRIFEPGASTSYRPSIFFFERRLPCIFLASLNSSACCFRGRGRQAFVRRKRDSPSVPFVPFCERPAKRGLFQLRPLRQSNGHLIIYHREGFLLA